MTANRKRGRMSEPSPTTTEARWHEFETLGQEEVRKRLAASILSEEKSALARQGLNFPPQPYPGKLTIWRDPPMRRP